MSIKCVVVVAFFDRLDLKGGFNCLHKIKKANEKNSHWPFLETGLLQITYNKTNTYQLRCVNP